MGVFYYEARTKEGEKTSGVLNVNSEKDVVWELKKEGLMPIKIEAGKEKKSWQKGLVLFRRVPLAEKVMFTQHLAVMIKGGVSLPESLEILSEQTKSPYFSKVLRKVSQKVIKGVSLHEAIASFDGVFSPLFVSMVEVGEILGKLEDSLKVLTAQMKKEHELKSKIKGAMMYPAVVLSAMVGIGVLMMVVVIPRMTEFFDELDVELPITTRFLIGLSGFLQNHYLWVLAGAAVLFLLVRAFVKSGTGQRLISLVLIKTPLLKNLVLKVNSARFCRSLSSLINGGVPIVKSLEIVSSTVSNVYYKKAIKEAAAEVKKGVALNSVLKQHPEVFPDLVIQMTRVGEETGMSGDVLKQLADFYEDEVDTITKSMSSIVEPVLMIIIGAAVGFFAISMLQPMYSIVDVI